MKININSIPTEGVSWEEDILPSVLDLDTDIIKFQRPIKLKATIYKITNTITVHLALSTLIYLVCSRCLKEFESDFKKDLKLNYTVNKLEPMIDTSTSLECRGEPFDSLRSLRANGEPVEPERSRTIDLDPDIREEIILDYPLKPLCMPDCKGLCPKCGKNLNEGDCSCAIT